jgi:hypothetical protein
MNIKNRMIYCAIFFSFLWNAYVDAAGQSKTCGEEMNSVSIQFKLRHNLCMV